MNDAPDFQAATQAQQATWSKGDFAEVAHLVVPVAEKLAEALQLVPDERVLDVACGSGNGALAAARRNWAAPSAPISCLPSWSAAGNEPPRRS